LLISSPKPTVVASFGIDWDLLLSPLLGDIGLFGRH
jgi:hypothetical protein